MLLFEAFCEPEFALACVDWSPFTAKFGINVKMSSPFDTLNENNTAQVTKYLRFFRSKKDALIRAVTREADDARADKLIHEDLYSKEDMEDFADFLVSSMRSHIVADVGSMINMGALSIAQLLEQGQENGVELDLETAAVENAVLLEAVDRMNLDAIPKSRTRGLTSMKDEARILKDKVEAAEELSQRLQDENAELVRKLAIARRSGGESKQGEEMLADALAEAKEENEKRVRDTNQFKQMKKLMQTQAQNIKELRKRLQQYEPDDDADMKDEC